MSYHFLKLHNDIIWGIIEYSDNSRNVSVVNSQNLLIHVVVTEIPAKISVSLLSSEISMGVAAYINTLNISYSNFFCSCPACLPPTPWSQPCDSLFVKNLIWGLWSFSWLAFLNCIFKQRELWLLPWMLILKTCFNL